MGEINGEYNEGFRMDPAVSNRTLTDKTGLKKCPIDQIMGPQFC
jgi:hypothetical protein